MPATSPFLVGSNLAIAATANEPELAETWIAALTGPASEAALAARGEVLPNSNALLVGAASDPSYAAFARSADLGWFVPVARGWKSVEDAGVLPELLAAITTGGVPVPVAARAARAAITAALSPPGTTTATAAH